MKYLKRSIILSCSFIIVLSLFQCKTQNIRENVPFTISEKSYFYWTAEDKGTTGISIKITGNFETTNLEFTTIYFQDREYKIVPDFTLNRFTLIGNYTTLNKKDIIMHQGAQNEYGNEAPIIEQKIPFELESDEAIMVYTINGKEHFLKIVDIKQLEAVKYP